MEHANYGGHYVISAANLSGEYFLKTRSILKDTSLSYVASYYIYDPVQGMPYRHYMIDSLQITNNYDKK